MRDEYGHEYQRWGVCRRCGCDHGDLAATEPCPGELRDLATEQLAVLPGLPDARRPNGPSKRRRRVEDLALADYVLRVVEVEVEAQMGDLFEQAPAILDAFQQGVAPDAIDWPVVEPAYVHNPNCGGTCGDVCNG